MTRYPKTYYEMTGLPPDLCFMRRVRTTSDDDVAWQFRSEGDLTRVNASTYTLFLTISERYWSGTANLMQVRSFELSQMQVDVLRALLPPAELAYATALTLGIGK